MISPELTIIVPTYNERENVRPLIDSLDRALQSVSWEVIFVDDDSRDGTAALVRKIGLKDPRVRCLRRIGRRGDCPQPALKECLPPQHPISL